MKFEELRIMNTTEGMYVHMGDMLSMLRHSVSIYPTMFGRALCNDLELTYWEYQLKKGEDCASDKSSV